VEDRIRPATLYAMALGQFGIWRRYQDGTGAAREIEALGFGALWLGGSPTIDQARPFLEQTQTLTVTTAILNVWRSEPADVAAGHARLRSEFGGRFLLGIGIGHPESTGVYAKPLTKMRDFLDGLDAAEQPVPRDQRFLAALRPKMLDLAADRTLGAHPYFTPRDHTRVARERIGPDALLAPEVTVVVDPDPDSARAKARKWAAHYLGLANYAGNLLRLGFKQHDLEDGGSDRLIDTVIPHGSAEAVADALRAHIDAGADHVCLQAVGGDARRDYRALAAVLL
jgi:probable F420-dependent oxidoreductase